jgi:hypothetical protein
MLLSYWQVLHTVLHSNVAAESRPLCGTFLGAVVRDSASCSAVKYNAIFYPIYNVTLPPSLCTDINKTAPYRFDAARTAQDRGSPWFGGTGNGSYLQYTSGSGSNIYQISLDKTAAVANATVRATLPKYKFVIGMVQVRHSSTLYVATESGIYAAAPLLPQPAKSTGGVRHRDPVAAVSLIADLRSLSLSNSSLLTAVAADGSPDATAGDSKTGSTETDHVYLIDGDNLHTITVTSAKTDASDTYHQLHRDVQIASINTTILPPPLKNHVVHAEFVRQAKLMLVLLDTQQLFTLDPTTGRAALVNITCSNGNDCQTLSAAQAPAKRVVATMGIGTFIYANETTISQFLLDPDLKSAFLGDQEAFDPSSIQGAFQYFV